MLESTSSDIYVGIICLLVGIAVGVVATLIISKKINPSKMTYLLILDLAINTKDRLTAALADGKITADEWRVIGSGVMSDVNAIILSIAESGKVDASAVVENATVDLTAVKAAEEKNEE